MNDWISVKDNLPEEEERVLGFDGNCQMGCFVCVYTFRDGDFIDDEGFSYACSEVTHWMPLPAPPKEKEN